MYNKELILAKKAAKIAGEYLVKERNRLNEIISSTEKDIKLKAEK